MGEGEVAGETLDTFGELVCVALGICLGLRRPSGCCVGVHVHMRCAGEFRRVCVTKHVLSGAMRYRV